MLSILRQNIIIKIVSIIVAYLIAFQPVYLAAQTIKPLARTIPRPTLDKTHTGLDLINIAQPRNGISHNLYTDFNVSNKGLILNNSSKNVQTQLSGWVEANPNIKPKNNAKLIINEVVGTTDSQLKGFIEVAGPKADVVIANENGVTCRGCGFLNTQRGTITTGKTIINDQGLSHLEVTRGKVTIGGDGLNASELDQLDVLSRAIDLYAKVKAKKVTLVTGANKLPYQDVLATDKILGQNQANLALDVSALGGMYADQINLKATDQGVGVNVSGNLTSLATMTLNVDGTLTNSGTITSKKNMTIQEAHLNNQGEITALEDISVQTKGALTNSGTIVANKNLTVESATLANQGEITALEQISVQTKGALTNSGKIISNKNANFEVSTLTNQDGLIWADQNISIDKDGLGGHAETVVNRQGRLEALTGDIVINADNIKNIGKKPSFTKNAYERTWYDKASDQITDPIKRLRSLIREDVFDPQQIVKPEYAEAYAQLIEATLSGTSLSESALDLVRESQKDGDDLKSETKDFWAGIGAKSGLGIAIGQKVRDLIKPTVLLGERQIKPEYQQAYAHLWDILVDGRDLTEPVRDILQPDVLSADQTLKTSYRSSFTKMVAGTGATYTIKKTLRADVLHNNGILSEIVAGGDIKMDAKHVSNHYGTVSAVGDIAVQAMTLENRALGAVQTLHEVRKQACFSCHVGILAYGDTFGGVIQAHGRINISALLSVTNVTDPTREGTEGLPHVHEMRNDQHKTVKEPVSSVDRSQLTASKKLLSDPLHSFDVSELIPEKLTDLLKKGPFLEAPATAQYKIETRPPFTNLTTFLGSSYLVDRLGVGSYDPDATPRYLGDATPRYLGDAWFEHQFIKSQLRRKSGKSSLFGSGLSPQAQIKQLYDNAVVASDRLDLKMGQKLTVEQVSALDKPIIWLEKRMVSGEEVLVPRLYLSAVDQVQITKGGALIRGSSVDIASLAVFYNDGTIKADDTVRVSTLKQLVNDGRLQADQAVTLTAGDSLHHSGSIIAGSAQLKAGKNIVLRGGAVQTAGKTGMSAGESINFAAVKQVSTGKRGGGTYRAVRHIGAQIETGGDLTLAAGQDVRMQGTRAFVGNDLSITAGRNIDISATPEFVEFRFHSKKKAGFFSSGKETRHYQSHLMHDLAQLSAVGRVTLDAGSDISLTGVDLYGRQSIDLLAGDTLEIKHVLDQRIVLDSFITQAPSANLFGGVIGAVIGGLGGGVIGGLGGAVIGTFGGGFGGDDYYESRQEDDTLVRSSVRTVGELTTRSGGDTTLSASRLQAGGQLALNVGVGPKAKSDARLFLKSGKDRQNRDVKSSASGVFFWEKHDYGHFKEQVRQALLVNGTGLKITTPGGIVVEYRDTGDFDQSIAQLSKIPGLAYLAQLRQRDDVDWGPIQQAYHQWDYQDQGISSGLATLIALSVAAGVHFVATVAPVMQFNSAWLPEALNAGLTTLITTSTISLMNNQGDIGAVLKELASLDFVREVSLSILTTGLTAGLTQSLASELPSVAGKLGLDATSDLFEIIEDVQTNLVHAAINTGLKSTLGGQRFSDALRAELRMAASLTIGKIGANHLSVLRLDGNLLRGPLGDVTYKLAHGILGCVTGEIAADGGCLPGAVGGVVGETVAEELRDILINQNLSGAEKTKMMLYWQKHGIVDLSKLAGALAATAVGLDASIAAQTAGNATRNNALFLLPLLLVAAQAMMTAYDLYQTVEALYQAIESGDKDRILWLCLELLGETAAGVGLSLVPGGKIATKAISKVVDVDKVVDKVNKVADKIDKIVDRVVDKLNDMGFGDYAQKLIQKVGRKTCSFAAATLVLTSQGYQSIDQVRSGDQVWSRHGITGQMSWQAVEAHYANDYPETVTVAIRDVETGTTQQIISNRIHPFFVQVSPDMDLPPSSEGHHYQGVLEKGHWVDAADLKPGYRLLNSDGSWARVSQVDIHQTPLKAYNLTVANTHTYFVRGASDQPISADDTTAVWVHNTCSIADLKKNGGTRLDETSFISAEGDLYTKQPNGKYGRERKATNDELDTVLFVDKKGFHPNGYRSDFYDPAGTPLYQLDPQTNKLKKITNLKDIQKDHIFPKAAIERLPGFKDLTGTQQRALLDYKANYQPLTKVENASKGCTVNGTDRCWNGIKSKNLPNHPGYNKWLEKEQDKMRDFFEKQIEKYIKLNEAQGIGHK